jgi:hypothetical protein
VTITNNSDGIIVSAGTETWETVLAYNNTNALGLITDNGDRSYTLAANARIFASGGVLNISDVQIRFSTTATIQAVGASGSVVNFLGCSLLLPAKTYTTSITSRIVFFDWSWSNTTSSATRDLTNTTRQINFNGCYILQLRTGTSGGNNSVQVGLTNFVNSLFEGKKTDGADNTPNNSENGIVVNVQKNAILDNARFTSIFRTSFQDPLVTLSGVTYDRCRDSIGNNAAGLYTFFNAQILTPSAVVASAFASSTIEFLNLKTDFTLGLTSPYYAFHNGSGGTASVVRKGYTTRLKFGTIQNVKVRFSDGTNTYNALSDASGQVALNLITQVANGSNNFTNSVTNFNTWSSIYRLYGYKAVPNSGFTLASAIGTPEAFLTYLLTVDPVVFASLATASGYTQANSNYSTSTVSISGTITPRQIYDRIQWELYQDANLFSTDHFNSADGLNFTANYNWTISAPGLITSSPLATITWASGKTVTLGATGTYNGFYGSIAATGGVNVPNGSTVKLPGWTGAGGTIAITGYTSGNTATVEVDNLSQWTAGPGVTLQTPQTTLVLSGIPTGANAIVGVIDLTTMTQTFPTIVGSTATIPTNPARSYFIACDARGYLRQAVTLAGNVPSYTFNLPNFTSLYNAGTAGADITLNTTTYAVTVGDSIPNLSLATVFRAIEDLLATPVAVFFSTPPYPIIVSTGSGSARQYLFFPYDTVANTSNPVRISPKVGNLIDPTLTDFVIIHEGSSAPLFTIFDFTSAGGRTIRYQTEAVAASVTVSGSGALTTEQAAQLAALNATLISSGIFSSGALVNAPSAGLSAAGMRTALGMATANLDTQLTGINTNIDEIPTINYISDLTTIKNKTNNLPASPASTNDVQVTVNGGFTSGDRSMLDTIPTLVEIEASTVIAKETTVQNAVAAANEAANNAAANL